MCYAALLIHYMPLQSVCFIEQLFKSNTIMSQAHELFKVMQMLFLFYLLHYLSSTMMFLLTSLFGWATHIKPILRRLDLDINSKMIIMLNDLISLF